MSFRADMSDPAPPRKATALVFSPFLGAPVLTVSAALAAAHEQSWRTPRLLPTTEL